MTDPNSPPSKPGLEPKTLQKSPEKTLKTGENGSKEAKTAPEWVEKNQELTELLQRTRAEFENYKKRVEKEKQAVWAFGQIQTLQPLLPVLDSFGHAKEKATEAEKKALEPLSRQFWEILHKMGVEEIHAKGKKFDPDLQDCLLVEHDSRQPDGVVLEELHKGYTLHGMALRHAKVKVNRIETEKEPKKEELHDSTGP